jgi:nicotinamidase-related amidase
LTVYLPYIYFLSYRAIFLDTSLCEIQIARRYSVINVITEPFPNLTAAMLFQGDAPMSLLRDTLVIVDMQPDLPASRPDWLRQAVRNLIDRALADNMAVVVLEYLTYEPLRFYGDTYEELIAAARGLAHFAMRAKSDLDGSARVADALKSMGLDCARFLVCGINTHACVEATAVGLTTRYPASRIEVVASACNDWCGNDWSKFAQRANLTVVPGLN